MSTKDHWKFWEDRSDCIEAWASRQETKDALIGGIVRATYIHDVIDVFANVKSTFRADKDVALVACKCNGQALKYASDELKNDREVVRMACQRDCHLKQDKEANIDLEIERSYSDEVALEDEEDDDVLILTASERVVQAVIRPVGGRRESLDKLYTFDETSGLVLQYASAELRGDEDIVLFACRHWGSPLQFADEKLQNKKKLVMTICQTDGMALEHASIGIQDDKEVVMIACKQDGNALEFASERLREDRDCIRAAVGTTPEALKFALGGLNQDPTCLIDSGLWDEDYCHDTKPKEKNIVLSTKFALAEQSSPTATRFTVFLKRNKYIQKMFNVYSPNAQAKSTCDPEWTNIDHPCRGTLTTCDKISVTENKEGSTIRTSGIGIPTGECCWRYSFRYQLERAKRTNGIMVQIVERGAFSGRSAEEPWLLEARPQLGKGQQIELEMAAAVGIKTIQVFEPWYTTGGGESVSKLHFQTHHIDTVVQRIQRWYDDSLHENNGDAGLTTDFSPCEEVHLDPAEKPNIRIRYMNRWYAGTAKAEEAPVSPIPRRSIWALQRKITSGSEVYE